MGCNRDECAKTEYMRDEDMKDIWTGDRARSMGNKNCTGIEGAV